MVAVVARMIGSDLEPDELARRMRARAVAKRAAAPPIPTPTGTKTPVFGG